MSPTSNYELKFLGPRRRAAPARRWLQATCRPDPIFPESTVYTVYYDTATLASLSEKQNSDYLKTKVRLRWYRVGNRFSETAFVEIKLRVGSQRDKTRVPVPYHEAWATPGSLDGPLLRDMPSWLRTAGVSLAEAYRPVLLVRYTRHRFIEPATGVRLCVDTDICVPVVSRATRLVHCPLPLSTSVFELKGPHHELPEKLRLLPTFGFRRSSFSKYRACYDCALALSGQGWRRDSGWNSR